jgi:hypothetical protein
MMAGQLSLDPLKRHGQAALDCSDIPGLQKAVLREIHYTCDNFRCESLARISPDLFVSYASDDSPDLFPLDCVISSAVVDFYFSDTAIPRFVTLDPTFLIRPERLADLEIIQRWASLRGFLTNNPSCTTSDEQTVAIA